MLVFAFLLEAFNQSIDNVVKRSFYLLPLFLHVTSKEVFSCALFLIAECFPAFLTVLYRATALNFEITQLITSYSRILCASFITFVIKLDPRYSGKTVDEFY